MGWYGGRGWTNPVTMETSAEEETVADEVAQVDAEVCEDEYDLMALGVGGYVHMQGVLTTMSTLMFM